MRKISYNRILLVVGHIDEYEQCFLVTDKMIIFEVKKVELIPLILLAAYFGYNIEYPAGCRNFYLFLEVFFLKAASTNVPLYGEAHAKFTVTSIFLLT